MPAWLMFAQLLEDYLENEYSCAPDDLGGCEEKIQKRLRDLERSRDTERKSKYCEYCGCRTEGEVCRNCGAPKKR